MSATIKAKTRRRDKSLTVLAPVGIRSSARVRQSTGRTSSSSTSEAESQSSPVKKGRRKSARILPLLKQPYDADKENSSGSVSEANSSPQLTDEYEFDEIDVMPIIDSSNKKQKKTVKSGSKLRTSKKKSTDKKCTSNKICSSKSSAKTMGSKLKSSKISPSSSTPVFSVMDNKQMESSHSKRQITDVNSEQSVNKRRKQNSLKLNAITDGTLIKKQNNKIKTNGSRSSKRKLTETINITPIVRRKVEKPGEMDSGMFISPPPKKLLRLTAKGTSTPSENLTSTIDDSSSVKLGFDESVSLLFSPVEKVLSPSPTSDYCSIDYSIPQFSLGDISKPTFEDEDQSDIKLNKSINIQYKPAKVKIDKVKKTKARYSVSKVDAWAEKVNNQFDEIERFELSIED